MCTALTGVASLRQLPPLFPGCLARRIVEGADPAIKFQGRRFVGAGLLPQGQPALLTFHLWFNAIFFFFVQGTHGQKSGDEKVEKKMRLGELEGKSTFRADAMCFDWRPSCQGKAKKKERARHPEHLDPCQRFPFRTRETREITGGYVPSIVPGDGVVVPGPARKFAENSLKIRWESGVVHQEAGLASVAATTAATAVGRRGRHKEGTTRAAEQR